LGKHAVEDYSLDVLGVINKLIDLGEESLGGLVMRSYDISTSKIIITNIDDQVVLSRNLVTFDDVC
jgi:hypothetical protein